MARRIFISHSVKTMQPGEADESLAYARAVRTRIVAGLRSAGHEVLLDEACLQPGTDWRATLHRWLGDCDGAVILLDGASVESLWLRKEAMILAWRQSLGSPVEIVPALLGSFRPEHLERAGLDDLARLQAARLADEALTEENADAVAAQVLSRFAGDPRPDNSEMAAWTRDVARILATVPADVLREAARGLDVEDDDWARFGDREVTVAHQLLHVGLASAVEALLRLKDGLPQRELFRRLVDLLVPTWVESAAAAHLRSLLARAEPPVVLVNVRTAELGRDYVSRAMCRLVDDSLFIEATDVTGEGGADELLTRYEQAIIQNAGLGRRHNPLERNPHKLTRFLRNKYVLLGAGAARTELLGALRQRLGPAALIVVSDVDTAPVRRAAPDITVVQPELDEDTLDESEIVRFDVERLRGPGD